MSDSNFEQILAQMNQAYKESEEFGNDWMPEDGGYIVTVMKCQAGVLKEGGIPWWKLTVRIEDPGNEKLNGREFPLGFFSGKVFGIVKSTARSLNKGEPVADIHAAHQVFKESVGTVCEVSVKTKPDKNGINRTNVYINKILDVSESVEEITPPQSGGA